MPKGNCSLEEFGTQLLHRIESSTTDAQGNSRTISKREQIDKINLAAETLAKELNVWIAYSDAMQLGRPYPSGVENDVYLDTETHTIFKINNLMTSKSVLALIRRLIIHNNVFPQTKYELVGFTGFGHGSIYPILSQDYIPNATYATHGEILDYMEALGFCQNGEASFTNGTLTISDLRPRNVLKTPNNLLFVVDADFILSNDCGWGTNWLEAH